MIPAWISETFWGATACAGVALYGTFVPGCRLWGSVTSRGSGSAGEVALTFDDGPTQGGSDRILDRLGQLGVPATFFVIGRHVERHPALLRRMEGEGHTVGNHSYHHAHFGMFGGPRYWLNEITRTDELIAQAIGRRPALFRPPMGFLTWPIHRAARRTGHTVIAWSQRGRDGIVPNTDEILRRLGNPRPGEIQLLHDGVDPHLKQAVDRSATVAAIAPLVAAIRRAGMEFAPLHRMLGIEAWQGEKSET